MDKKLYRIREGKVICGVCAGAVCWYILWQPLSYRRNLWRFMNN